MRRVAAILLVIILVLGGCSVEEGKSKDGTNDPTAAPTSAAAVPVQNIEDLKVTVMTVDGDPVSLAELRYQIASLLSAYEYYGDGEVDWDEEIDGKPARDFFMDEAVNTCKLFRAVERYATDSGYQLSAARRAELDDELAQYVSDAGGDEAFDAQLAETGMTRELYEYLVYVPELYYHIYNSMYGEGGPKAISDADVDSYFAENYLTTRHILKIATDDDGSDLPADMAAEILAEIRTIREGITDSTDFAALAADVSDDDTLAGEPITFELTTMPEAYVAAAQMLQPGGTSDVVDIDGAYVIVRREQLDTGYLTDNRDVVKEEYGLKLFRAVLEPVRDSLAVEYADAFGEVDVDEVYRAFFTD